MRSTTNYPRYRLPTNQAATAIDPKLCRLRMLLDRLTEFGPIVTRDAWTEARRAVAELGDSLRMENATQSQAQLREIAAVLGHDLHDVQRAFERSKDDVACEVLEAHLNAARKRRGGSK